MAGDGGDGAGGRGAGFDPIWLGDHLLDDLPNGEVRGPSEVDATAAVLVRLPGGAGRLMGEAYDDRTVRPVPVGIPPEPAPFPRR